MLLFLSLLFLTHAPEDPDPWVAVTYGINEDSIKKSEFVDLEPRRITLKMRLSMFQNPDPLDWDDRDTLKLLEPQLKKYTFTATVFTNPRHDLEELRSKGPEACALVTREFQHEPHYEDKLWWTDDGLSLELIIQIPKVPGLLHHYRSLLLEPLSWQRIPDCFAMVDAEMPLRSKKSRESNEEEERLKRKKRDAVRLARRKKAIQTSWKERTLTYWRAKIFHMQRFTARLYAQNKKEIQEFNAAEYPEQFNSAEQVAQRRRESEGVNVTQEHYEEWCEMYDRAIIEHNRRVDQKRAEERLRAEAAREVASPVRAKVASEEVAPPAPVAAPKRKVMAARA